LKRDLLCADETTLQVLREPGKTARSKSYMWLYRTAGDGLDKPVVLYDYQPSRSQQHPKHFLRGYKGFLHCDYSDDVIIPTLKSKLLFHWSFSNSLSV